MILLITAVIDRCIFACLSVYSVLCYCSQTLACSHWCDVIYGTSSAVKYFRNLAKVVNTYRIRYHYFPDCFHKELSWMSCSSWHQLAVLRNCFSEVNSKCQNASRSIKKGCNLMNMHRISKKRVCTLSWMTSKNVNLCL